MSAQVKPLAGSRVAVAVAGGSGREFGAGPVDGLEATLRLSLNPPVLHRATQVTGQVLGVDGGWSVSGGSP